MAKKIGSMLNNYFEIPTPLLVAVRSWKIINIYLNFTHVGKTNNM